MSAPIHIESIELIHRILALPPPPNPLFAVIAATWQPPLTITIPIVGRPILSSLYIVSLKRGDECHAEFGRQLHDGQAGSVVFVSPGQVITPLEGSGEPAQGDGWTLVFHPDLLRDRPLAAVMSRYRFFGYAAREALHVEEAEREMFTGIVRRMEVEASVAPDAFADDVLASQLQLLFGYFERAYARQFAARAKIGGKVAERLDRHLDEHFASDERRKSGLPTVRSCARALGYSPDYLSDLLRAETGAGARDHIHHAVIEAAKARLLSPEVRSSDVAYALGFEHPQQFSRLFRQKTGQSPGEWRRRGE